MQVKIEALSLDSAAVELHPDGTGASREQATSHLQIPLQIYTSQPDAKDFPELTAPLRSSSLFSHANYADAEVAGQLWRVLAYSDSFLVLGCVLLASGVALLFMKKTHISGPVGGH